MLNSNSHIGSRWAGATPASIAKYQSSRGIITSANVALKLLRPLVAWGGVK